MLQAKINLFMQGTIDPMRPIRGACLHVGFGETDGVSNPLRFWQEGARRKALVFCPVC